MIVVTGGAGFIGSNLVHALNGRGRGDVVVVDDLTRSEKFANLVGAEVADYVDKDRFPDLLASGAGWVPKVEAVLHQGACSSTTEPDGRYLIENNYEYSKRLLDACLSLRVPFLYASSAAVYGRSDQFAETPANERPLNVYGFSKLMFDRHVRRTLPSAASQVAGLRYFNVYGPREGHKGEMASVVTRFDDAVRRGEAIRIFGAGEGMAAGEHRRDFVAVTDVVDVILWFLDHPDRSGVVNCGSGTATSFNEVAAAVVAARGGGEVEYVPFPDHLRGRYQPFTRADLSCLRSLGYEGRFSPIDAGVAACLASGVGE